MNFLELMFGISSDGGSGAFELVGESVENRRLEVLSDFAQLSHVFQNLVSNGSSTAARSRRESTSA